MASFNSCCEPYLDQLAEYGTSQLKIGRTLCGTARGVTVVAGSERSCQAFCGYHDRSAGGLYYAVVPTPIARGASAPCGRSMR